MNEIKKDKYMHFTNPARREAKWKTHVVVMCVLAKGPHMAAGETAEENPSLASLLP
jgi:hypothetical protein